MGAAAAQAKKKRGGEEVIWTPSIDCPLGFLEVSLNGNFILQAVSPTFFTLSSFSAQRAEFCEGFVGEEEGEEENGAIIMERREEGWSVLRN